MIPPSTNWVSGRVSPHGKDWLAHYAGKDFTRKPWWTTVMKRIRNYLILFPYN